MDSGIASAINQQLARKVTLALDSYDRALGLTVEAPWYLAGIGETLMDASPERSPDRAWLVGSLLGVGAVNWNAYPADGDWEILFSLIRAEIQARRDTDSSSAHAAETPTRSMV